MTPNLTFPNGVVFMMDKYVRDENSIFPAQFYNWDFIKSEIAPLVENVLKKPEAKRG